MRKLVSRNQWEIITVSGVEVNGIKNRVEFKVPEAFESIDEIMFGAVDSNSPAGGTTEVFAPTSKGNVLGTLSLHTNDKSTHPIHLKVQIKPLAEQTRKTETLKLQEPLRSGSLVQGYYIDAGVSPNYPYNLKIYLRGKHRFEGREECSTH